MSSQRVLCISLVFGIAMIAIPWIASASTAMLEVDMRLICTDSGETRLPKQLTLHQVIDDSFFATAFETEVYLAASYPFRLDVNSGKVIVQGLLLKGNGSEMTLPKVVGKMRNGDADKTKRTQVVIEPGDIIEWKIKNKGLKPLQGIDCWSLQVGIASADVIGGLSRLTSQSAVIRAEE